MVLGSSPVAKDWLLYYDPLTLSWANQWNGFYMIGTSVIKELKILYISAISLKHGIIVAKVLKILLDSNVTFSRTLVLWENKYHSEVIFVYIFNFYERHYVTKIFLERHFRNSTRVDFRWLTKSIEIFTLDNRSFCRCNSLRFFISMVLPTTYGIKYKIASLQICSWEKMFWKYELNLRQNTHVEVRFQ